MPEKHMMMCAPPTKGPFAQVCFSCPPPCPIPICPAPVKPLQIPCPNKDSCDPKAESIAAARNQMESRYDNFYNNYNRDWHATGHIHGLGDCVPKCLPIRATGMCLDGKKPCCSDYKAQVEGRRRRFCCELPGCPTGFKPCKMRLTPPLCCNPCGTWEAQIQKCPPKPQKKVTRFEHKPCRRPCCKHWSPKEGPCMFNTPCKAHCYNTPPGMRPTRLRCCS